QVQGGGHARFDGSTPGREIRLMPGAVWSGAGTLRLNGSCQLIINQDTTVPGGLAVDSEAAITGTGQLTLNKAYSLSGIFNVPLNLLSGAAVNFSSVTFNGDLLVQPGAVLDA